MTAHTMFVLFNDLWFESQRVYMLLESAFNSFNYNSTNNIGNSVRCDVSDYSLTGSLCKGFPLVTLNFVTSFHAIRKSLTDPEYLENTYNL